jgi:hypothetical protein
LVSSRASLQSGCAVQSRSAVGVTSSQDCEQ